VRFPFHGEAPFLVDDAGVELYAEGRNPADLICSLTGERGIWKSNLPLHAEGLAPTYCGHSVVRHPCWSLGHFNLDTGAGLDDTRLEERRLTLLCFQNQTLWETSTRTGAVHSRAGPVQPRAPRRTVMALD
jgi:hypothetical protein